MPVIATRKMSLKLAHFCVVRAALSEKVAAPLGRQHVDKQSPLQRPHHSLRGFIENDRLEFKMSCARDATPVELAILHLSAEI